MPAPLPPETEYTYAVELSADEAIALDASVAFDPLELATAYAAFAAQGRRPTPRFVLRVEDPNGEVVFETEPARTEVTDAATAFLLTDMLRDVVDRGTGAAVRRVGFHGPAAGKTGTTTDATDVWFVGYTPELVGAVWVGFDEMEPLPPRATGGGVAAPVWGRVMARVYRDRPVPDWRNVPGHVVALWIDPETGLALEDGCRPRRGEPHRELFLEGEEPITVCPQRGRRDFFDHVGGWLESVFGSGRSAPSIPGEADPDLGVPRLPRRDGGSEGGRDGRDGIRRSQLEETGQRAWSGDARHEAERGREARKRAEERVREEQKREEERIREARKRAEEQLREALKRQEEAAREARKRAEERRREGGGG